MLRKLVLFVIKDLYDRTNLSLYDFANKLAVDESLLSQVNRVGLNLTPKELNYIQTDKGKEEIIVFILNSY